MAISPRKNNRISNLRFAIDELRRKYDEVEKSYDSVRTRVLALIGVELTIFTFFFSQISDLPATVYGLIFYVTAVISLFVSFSLLMIGISGVQWRMPSDRNNMRFMIDENYTEERFLENIEKEYRDTVTEDLAVLAKRGDNFNKSLMLLVVGVIILVVLKYGKAAIL